MGHRDEAALRASLRRLQGTVDLWLQQDRRDLAPETIDLLDDVDLRLRRLARELDADEGAAAVMPASARRSNGWNRNLFRDTNRAWLAGVCAGIARSLEVDRWIVRLVVVAIAVFNLPLALLGYLAAMVLLARRNAPAEAAASAQQGERAARPGRVRDVARRFDELEHRLRDMEGHVTSRQFALHRELADLERRS